MNVQEAAEQIGLSPDAIYDLCRLGVLGHRRVGPRRGRIQITPEHVAAYLQKAERGGDEVPPEKPSGVRRPKKTSGRRDGKPLKHFR